MNNNEFLEYIYGTEPILETPTEKKEPETKTEPSQQIRSNDIYNKLTKKEIDSITDTILECCKQSENHTVTIDELYYTIRYEQDLTVEQIDSYIDHWIKQKAIYEPILGTIALTHPEGIIDKPEPKKEDIKPKKPTETKTETTPHIQPTGPIMNINGKKVQLYTPEELNEAERLYKKYKNDHKQNRIMRFIRNIREKQHSQQLRSNTETINTVDIIDTLEAYDYTWNHETIGEV